MEIERNTWAEINLDAYAHNINIVKKKINPNTKLCAVVKANAYGHGAVAMALEAERNGADMLAVAILQEAVELREAGIKMPIVVLGPLYTDIAEFVVKYDVAQTVFDEDRLFALNEIAINNNKKAKIHIKVDTGMNRIGIAWDKAGDFAELAASMPGIEVEGVFSHFASVDDEDKTYANFQLANFKKALADIEAKGINIPLKHIANSAAIMELEGSDFDMVREGIILYGLLPGDNADVYSEFRPVMTIKTKVAYLKNVPKGTSISYGCTYTTERDSVIASLPLGYADGLPRLLSNKGEMLIKGVKVPIVGRVCMDQVMVDVTDVPDVKVGDEVIVFGGKELPTEVVAELSQTNPHEVVCGISPRVPRVYTRD